MAPEDPPTDRAVADLGGAARLLSCRPGACVGEVRAPYRWALLRGRPDLGLGGRSSPRSPRPATCCSPAPTRACRRAISTC